MGKGIPPVDEIWFRYIFIAVDMRIPRRENTSSASFFTSGFILIFKVVVFSIKYHFFIVTQMTLQNQCGMIGVIIFAKIY